MFFSPAAALSRKKARGPLHGCFCRFPRCNKCVDTFDHHCPWLNTCVGRKNYHFFMGLLGSTCALTMLQIAGYVHTGVRVLTSDSQEERLEDVYGLPLLAYGILLSIIGAVVVAALTLILQLLTFHVGLIYRGMTTYEFIMEQRKKEKAMEAKNGGVDTWQQRLLKWIHRNAPCLAVCICCDCDEPATSTRATEPAHVQPKLKAMTPPCSRLQQQICSRASKQGEVATQVRPRRPCMTVSPDAHRRPPDHLQC